MLHKLSTSDYTTMPWKNGSGSTTQLAIFPKGATLDDFDWRISSATVGTSGAFSPFIGIDRSLAILKGSGLRLLSDTSVTLTPSSAPYFFAGETPIHAELIDGSVIDLNVMTRRNVYEHTLRALHLEGETVITLAGNQFVVAFHASGESAFVDGYNLSFKMGETLIIRPDQPALPQTISITSHNAWLYVAYIQHKEDNS